MKSTKILAAALAASTIAASTIAGSAVAADLPSRKAPVVAPVAVPVMTWTGFYVGLNAGYGWSAGAISTSAIPSFFAPTWNTEMNASATLATGQIPGSNKGGFIGGAQVGWNYQAGAAVLGVEADIQGLIGGKFRGATGGALVPLNFPAELIVSSTNATASTDWLGTVRARIGYLLTPSLLAYGTGGLAYGGVKSSVLISQANLPFVGANFFSGASSSTTRLGWTAGGGLEWKLTPNWSVKGEYLYYDLGRVSVAMSPLVSVVVPPYGSAVKYDASAKGHIARLGLNYQFGGAGGPVVAKY